MDKKRKIALVTNKATFTEVEDADNFFYASLSPEKRFDILIDLRRTIFGDSNRKIKKVVGKRSIHEATEN